MIRQVLGAAVLLLVGSPLGAQQLDPQVATPLLVMIQAAGARCQAGNAQACGQVQQMQQAGGQLAQAQFACQQGNPQACQAFQQGAQRVFAAYQQHVAAIGYPPQGPPPAVSGGGGPGYSQDQMTWEHQQRMREMERNARIQQNNAAAAAAQRDREHQRFLEQMRR